MSGWSCVQGSPRHTEVTHSLLLYFSVWFLHQVPPAGRWGWFKTWRGRGAAPLGGRLTTSRWEEWRTNPPSLKQTVCDFRLKHLRVCSYLIEQGHYRLKKCLSSIYMCVGFEWVRHIFIFWIVGNGMSLHLHWHVFVLLLLRWEYYEVCFHTARKM